MVDSIKKIIEAVISTTNNRNDLIIKEIVEQSKKIPADDLKENIKYFDEIKRLASLLKHNNYDCLIVLKECNTEE